MYDIDGSYSGIFPKTPLFFNDTNAMKLGYDIVNNLCDFFVALPFDLQSVVTGVTLMNEPAHLIPQYSTVMLNWLAGAIDIYRTKVVSKFTAYPKLYVNLIETSVSPSEMLEFMVSTFNAEELNSWAILDVHRYFAWDGSASGCMVCRYHLNSSSSRQFHISSIASLIIVIIHRKSMAIAVTLVM